MDNCVSLSKLFCLCLFQNALASGRRLCERQSLWELLSKYCGEQKVLQPEAWDKHCGELWGLQVLDKYWCRCSAQFGRAIAREKLVRMF